MWYFTSMLLSTVFFGPKARPSGWIPTFALCCCAAVPTHGWCYVHGRHGAAQGRQRGVFSPDQSYKNSWRTRDGGDGIAPFPVAVEMRERKVETHPGWRRTGRWMAWWTVLLTAWGIQKEATVKVVLLFLESSGCCTLNQGEDLWSRPQDVSQKAVS